MKKYEELIESANNDLMVKNSKEVRDSIRYLIENMSRTMNKLEDNKKLIENYESLISSVKKELDNTMDIEKRIRLRKELCEYISKLYELGYEDEIELDYKSAQEVTDMLAGNIVRSLQKLGKKI